MLRLTRDVALRKLTECGPGHGKRLDPQRHISLSGESRAARSDNVRSGGKRPDFGHITTLRVKAPFTRQTDHNPRSKGTPRYTRRLFEKMARFDPTDEAFSHPDPSQIRQNYRRAGYRRAMEKLMEGSRCFTIS